MKDPPAHGEACDWAVNMPLLLILLSPSLFLSHSNSDHLMKLYSRISCFLLLDQLCMIYSGSLEIHLSSVYFYSK